jgi:hypothetical protein
MPNLAGSKSPSFSQELAVKPTFPRSYGFTPQPTANSSAWPAHNLMRLLEDGLAEEGIGNAIEIKLRAGRSGAPSTGDGAVSTIPRWADCLREWLQRVTQRGVKFIRWLQAQLLVSDHGYQRST